MTSAAINREVAFAGHRVRRKVIFGLTLASLLPLLLLTYALQAPIRMLLGALGSLGDTLVVPSLVIFTGLLIAAGAFVIWDVATAVSRVAALLAKPHGLEFAAGPGRTDEIGTLMSSFQRLLATIEQQTDEINQFPQRLDELARHAFRDSLTGLPNRALFMDRLAHALTRSERTGEDIGVLLLDVDRFQIINDSLGHGAGDHLLTEVGRRLAACLRAEDTIARLGGDEFALLLEALSDRRSAARVADRIAAALHRPFVVEGRDVTITAALGIALSTGRSARPEDLLREAELAMYHAKGRALYEIFEASMGTAAQERLTLETDLRNAVSRDEFRLHYQPVVDLETGQVTEVEALIRWQHPRRGLLLPRDFLALSEETGLIVPIGRWVLREACRQARVWQEEHPVDSPAVMSINVSARQLQQSGLADDVVEILRETGLQPEALKLEVTEAAVMHDAPATLAKLEALKNLGVQLAIDDFGTGYSALGYLKRFPVDTLKIDRSFVKGIGRDVEQTAIVRAVMAVARTLNLKVTAEGIETGEQLSQLQALGCNGGQGYFFARPSAAGQRPPAGRLHLAA